MFGNCEVFVDVKRYRVDDVSTAYVCEAASTLVAASCTESCLVEDTALAASSGDRQLLSLFFSVNRRVSRCKTVGPLRELDAKSSAILRSRSGLSIPNGDRGSLCATRAIVSSGLVFEPLP